MSKLDAPPPSLPLEDNEVLDELCLEFEDAWLAGERPSLEALLEFAPPSHHKPLLYELLRIDLVYRRRQRETPSEAEYLARFPSHGEIVEFVFQRARPTTPQATTFEAGSKLDRYKILRKLGQGGFGAVYLAFDEQLERHVAIKTLTPARFVTHDDAERLAAEARTVAALHHASIASVYDVGVDDAGRIFVVFQHVEGSSLRQRLKAGPLDPVVAAELFATIADAIHFAHEQGFIHRDLEPGNILLDQNERPVVADFGLALHESLRAEARGQVAGSQPYMAPEQWRGGHVDARTDVWAIGVMLYESLCGRRPYSAKSEQDWRSAIERDPPPLRSRDGRIPAELEAICERCLHTSANQRYATAAELSAELRRWRAGWGPKRRQLLIAAASTFFLLALAAAALWKGWMPDSPPETELRLLVWRDEWRSARQGAVPLDKNDQVRLEVEASRPAHFYVLWVDAQGDVSPVYPWRDGKWEPLSSVSRRRISLPDEDPSSRWPMQVTANGAETIVLLARSTPLPDEAAALLAERLPPVTSTRRTQVAEFENGLPLVFRDGHKLIDRGARAPALLSPGKLDDPVLKRQRLIFQKFQPHFSLVRTLVAPTTLE